MSKAKAIIDVPRDVRPTEASLLAENDRLREALAAMTAERDNCQAAFREIGVGEVTTIGRLREALAATNEALEEAREQADHWREAWAFSVSGDDHARAAKRIAYHRHSWEPQPTSTQEGTQ